MSSENERGTSSQGSDQTPEKATPESSDTLTTREIEILNLIFSGRPSSEVAEILCVSKRTVDFHLSKAYGKLGVSNRVQAFKKAFDMGLIS